MRRGKLFAESFDARQKVAKKLSIIVCNVLSRFGDHWPFSEKDSQ